MRAKYFYALMCVIMFGDAIIKIPRMCVVMFPHRAVFRPNAHLRRCELSALVAAPFPDGDMAPQAKVSFMGNSFIPGTSNIFRPVPIPSSPVPSIDAKSTQRDGRGRGHHA